MTAYFLSSLGIVGAELLFCRFCVHSFLGRSLLQGFGYYFWDVAIALLIVVALFIHQIFEGRYPKPVFQKVIFVLNLILASLFFALVWFGPSNTFQGFLIFLLISAVPASGFFVYQDPSLFLKKAKKKKRLVAWTTFSLFLLLSYPALSFYLWRPLARSSTVTAARILAVLGVSASTYPISIGHAIDVPGYHIVISEGCSGTNGLFFLLIFSSFFYLSSKVVLKIGEQIAVGFIGVLMILGVNVLRILLFIEGLLNLKLISKNPSAGKQLVSAFHYYSGSFFYLAALFLYLRWVERYGARAKLAQR